MSELINLLWPFLAGWGMWWIAGKCRGRNARSAFRYAAWGFWLILLKFAPFALPFPLTWLSWIILLTPAAICFLLAGNSMLKEMRAQQRGEYTDAA